jgi:hypothetical protein
MTLRHAVHGLAIPVLLRLGLRPSRGLEPRPPADDALSTPRRYQVCDRDGVRPSALQNAVTQETAIMSDESSTAEVTPPKDSSTEASSATKMSTVCGGHDRRAVGRRVGHRTHQEACRPNGLRQSAFCSREHSSAGHANRISARPCDAVFDGDRRSQLRHTSRAPKRSSPRRSARKQPHGAITIWLLRVAYGGRACASVAGKWAEAVTDAQSVPTSFIFVAPFSTNTGAENNDLVNETTNRSEYTVFNTQWPRSSRRSAGAVGYHQDVGRRHRQGPDGKTNSSGNGSIRRLVRIFRW